MYRDQSRRFLYKAHAVGASGSFTKPRAEFMEAQASSALSIDGGMVSSRVDNFNYRDMISFRSASTMAVGTFDDATGIWTTLVTATIEGLNIMGVVTADRLTARLSSKHYASWHAARKTEGYMEELEEALDVHPKAARQASIVTVGSQIQNLMVAGSPVVALPDHQVTREWDTLKKAQDGCANRAGVRATKERDIIVTSIFPTLQVDRKLLPGENNVIKFDEFGTLHLGEIIIADGERRLTMLRVELGCAIDGNTNLGEVAGNGSPMPPQ